MNLLEDYGYYSGYKLNVTTTQILAINYVPIPELEEKNKIKWKLYTANYIQTNQELRRDIGRWSILQLDCSSRIEIIKMIDIQVYLGGQETKDPI